MNTPAPQGQTADDTRALTMPEPAVDGIGAAIQALITRPDLDVSKVRDLFELQREVRRDQAFADFNEKMSEAQEEMSAVSQDAASDKGKYASYAALDRAIRPIYSKHGFSVRFDTGDSRENEVRVVAEVARGGYSREYHFDVPADGKGAKGNDVMTKTHAAMSAITYGRRALLKMIFNIAESKDVDDDGKAAGKADDVLSSDQLAELYNLIEETGTEMSSLLAFIKQPRLEDVWASKFTVLKQIIKERRWEKRR